jgi:hypothetical protein
MGPALQVLAFIILLLSPAQGQLHLDPAVLEIETQRNQGETPLLNLPDQPADLRPVQEELPAALRVMVEPVGRRVGADVTIAEEDLPALHGPIAIPQVRPPLTERLDFSSCEGDARLKDLLDVEGLS